jgi:predicted transcriptional regulator
MSITDTGSNTKASVKTLAIRLEPDLHAQLSLIAQLRDSTLTDEIRTAIEAHITLAKTAPELAAQAGSVLETIEREAIARRAAIATMFGNEPQEVAAPPADDPAPVPTETVTATTPSTTSARGRGRKATDGQEVSDS